MTNKMKSTNVNEVLEKKKYLSEIEDKDKLAEFLATKILNENKFNFLESRGINDSDSFIKIFIKSITFIISNKLEYTLGSGEIEVIMDHYFKRELMKIKKEREEDTKIIRKYFLDNYKSLSMSIKLNVFSTVEFALPEFQ